MKKCKTAKSCRKEYHILHNYKTSTPFQEKSSDHFKNLHKMELSTNFIVNQTSFLGEVMN